MSGATTEMGFMADVEERPKGFFRQVKDFMRQTDGGAVPTSVAKAVLGISQATLYRLIEQEKECPGTGLRAWKFNNTVLICAKDIDRLADQPKRPPGRPKSKD